MFSEIDVERKKHLHNAAINIRNYIFKKNSIDYSAGDLFREAKHLYKKIYNDELKKIEADYFSLLVLIPDDNRFKKICNNNRYIDTTTKPYKTVHNFYKIGEAYAIKENVAKIRYAIMLDDFKNKLIDCDEKKIIKR